jgi:hypothetical protein
MVAHNCRSTHFDELIPKNRTDNEPGLLPLEVDDQLFAVAAAALKLFKARHFDLSSQCPIGRNVGRPKVFRRTRITFPHSKPAFHCSAVAGEEPAA